MDITTIFQIAILIMSVVIHEVSHGYVAYMLGDPTAKLAGRLTLNPIRHLDPIGSFVVPLITSLGGFIFGWAKPVPYNPYNLRNERWGTLLVAIAGVASNFLVAIVFGILIRVAPFFGIYSPAFFDIVGMIVFINIILAVFNLIPIPPLDGSKVLFSVLPYHLRYIQDFLERFWPIFLLLLIFVLWRFVFIVVLFLFTLITGISFF